MGLHHTSSLAPRPCFELDLLGSITRLITYSKYSLSFFWEAADGSHPDVTAISLYFLEQYFAVVAIFYLGYSQQGLRRDLVK